MDVHFRPDIEEKIVTLASTTGREADELIQDVMTGYLAELTEVTSTLDNRYDEIKSGKVQSADGEAFFESLRKREDELLKSHPAR
jgi:hypothetical protein